MGISGALLWWEKWQLRILVLSSLFVQWLLFISALRRKHAIPSWLRSIIWLAYLGSDALAIYALANLFSRQREGCSSGQGNSILEVVWAPVLLMHLGGQDAISAYNIEDNELWTRHVVTAVSQVTVAIYVFCKSWPGGDKRLLQAAILFFVPGILKCIEKPWALKNASINSLVSSSDPARKINTDRESDVNSLKDYVQKARAFVQVNHRRQTQGEDNVVDLEADHQPGAQGEATAEDLQPQHRPETSNTWRNRLSQQRERHRSQIDDHNVNPEAYRIFVDHASPYPDRFGILKSFWLLDEKQAYALMQNRLFNTFDLLYTKTKMLEGWEGRRAEDINFLQLLSGYIRLSAIWLPWVAIILFSMSQIQAYNDMDVKVTYILFCCTSLLEYNGLLPLMVRILSSKGQDRASLMVVKRTMGMGMQSQLVKKIVALYEWAKGKLTQYQWVAKVVALHEQAKTNVTQYLWTKVLQFEWERSTSSLVGQYALVEFFVRNKRHTKMMCILSWFSCKELFDQHVSMNPCKSSFAITELVLKYVKKGWEDQIKDVDSYWKFNDRRGQWTLQSNECISEQLFFSLRRPFDESILLWHIATDFCFYYMNASADHPCSTAQCIQDASGESHECAVWCERSPQHERAVQCREMSNYMMYLLFVNPEMLLAGTRRNLFLTANAEVEEILKEDKSSLKKILKAKKPGLKDIFKGEKQWLKEILGSKDLGPWIILKGMNKHNEILKGMRKESLKAKKKWLEEIERGLVQRIISKVQHTERRAQVVEHAGSPPDAERDANTRESFVLDAWKIANALVDIGDEYKMWEVIEGVWVEMLCFSASRCRGYLHAKSLGTGVELLTFIWLLLSHMGMETLPERLQRTDLSSGEENVGATPDFTGMWD